MHELLTHFFLLPQMTPWAISCSISGWRVVDGQEDGCSAAYRTSARRIADLLTVQPNASVASWPSCWRNSSASRVMVWVQMIVGFFRSGGFRFAMKRDINSLRERKQDVTRATIESAQQTGDHRP